MLNSPIVTYIKNGKEITKNITPFNNQKIMDELFKIYCFTDFYFQPDIELVYFKNFCFDKFIFKLTDKKLLILDNCTFNELYLYGGNVQIINPTSKNNDQIFIRAENIYDLDITLNNNSKDEIKIKLDFPCYKISLNGQNNSNVIMNLGTSRIQELSLSNLPNLIVSNSNSIQKLKIMNTNIIESEVYINTKLLDINNSTINATYFKTSKISGKNYTISSTNPINIGEYKWYTPNTYKTIITDKDVNSIFESSPKKLIFILKELKSLIDKDYTIEKEQINIKYNQKIIKKQKELAKLQKRKTTKIRKLTKKVNNTKVGEYSINHKEN